MFTQSVTQAAKDYEAKQVKPSDGRAPQPVADFTELAAAAERLIFECYTTEDPNSGFVKDIRLVAEFALRSCVPKPTGTEQEVCSDISERQKRGLAKYGTTVANNPLSEQEWLQHAYEETLDLAVYLKRLLTLQPKPVEQWEIVSDGQEDSFAIIREARTKKTVSVNIPYPAAVLVVQNHNAYSVPVPKPVELEKIAEQTSKEICREIGIEHGQSFTADQISRSVLRALQQATQQQ